MPNGKDTLARTELEQKKAALQAYLLDQKTELTIDPNLMPKGEPDATIAAIAARFGVTIKQFTEVWNTAQKQKKTLFEVYLRDMNEKITTDPRLVPVAQRDATIAVLAARFKLSMEQFTEVWNTVQNS